MAPLKRLLIPGGILALSAPVTLPAALRFFRADRYSSDSDPFRVDCGPGLSQSAISNTPIPGHEWKARNRADGLHLRLYMAGVPKEKVKVWVEGGDLIAEGVKEKDFEDEDDRATLMRYRVTRPPEELFDAGAMDSDISDGMLKVFVPRRSED